MDVNSFIVGYTKGKQSAGGGGEGGIAGFHKVQFFNDDRTTLLYTVFVPTGASAMYAGDTPISTENETFVFMGFEPSPASVTEDMDCYAVYEFIGTLDEASWSTISQLSANGMAQNYFAIGDTKTIHIEGTVGTIAINGDYGVYIIGFDHNEELEGNGIHFGTFKGEGGKDIALFDEKYKTTSTSGAKYFNMNHWGNYNLGGWAVCDMRYDILGSTDTAPLDYGSAKTFYSVGYDASVTCATNPVANTLMAALPYDLRAVMKPMTKYTNNRGGTGGNNEEYVTATVDYLPLLSEFEIKGAASWVEKEKQSRYEYFTLGNSWRKCSQLTDAYSFWATRTPYPDADVAFAYVFANDNNTGGISASYVLGLAPIFKV
jgi:hypothetical protein